MAKFDAQNTDAENSKAPPKSVNRDKVTVTQLGSTQAIARDRTDQNTQTGKGGENPGASIEKTVARNAG